MLEWSLPVLRNVNALTLSVGQFGGIYKSFSRHFGPIYLPFDCARGALAALFSPRSATVVCHAIRPSENGFSGTEMLFGRLQRQSAKSCRHVCLERKFQFGTSCLLFYSSIAQVRRHLIWNGKLRKLNKFLKASDGCGEQLSGLMYCEKARQHLQVLKINWQRIHQLVCGRFVVLA